MSPFNHVKGLFCLPVCHLNDIVMVHPDECHLLRVCM